MADLAVGVDLGGTNIKGALVDAERGLVRSISLKTEAAQGPEHVISRIAETVSAVLREGESPVGVGVGSPGVIDLDGRTVTRPPNFPGWEVIDLAGALQDRVALPVTVDNDANVAGLGSAYFGAGRPFGSFIMVTLGTGVGGAIILDRKIFRGAHGGAGELGHMSIDYEGPYARSGVPGAIEAYVGQSFLTHHARYQILTRESILHEWAGPELRGLNPRMLSAAAEVGDQAAVDFLAWVGHKLGCALGSAVTLLDIRKVVVGGGVSAAGDFILEPARLALHQFVMPAMTEGLEIVRETLGNEVGLLGAARLAFASAGARTDTG